MPPKRNRDDFREGEPSTGEKNNRGDNQNNNQNNQGLNQLVDLLRQTLDRGNQGPIPNVVIEDSDTLYSGLKDGKSDRIAAKEPVKRTFVTAHQLQLQQQKKNGKILRSSQLEKVLHVPVNKKGITKRKLDLQNDIQDDFIEVKKTRDKEIVECPPVNEYELVKESKRKTKDMEEYDEYIVENDSGDDSADSSERIKTVKEKKTVPGPRTRSRANATDLGKSGKDLEGDRRICDVGETSLPNVDEEADEEVQLG
ncbi:hypothetical protein POM88_016307 [Heracleum sosnowskyi]|uniref:Uncharacterized protein n=1 Tax=Heracleum sosnowskyi TaxID=360622 RepID=A0AAD8MWZ9_9APIA|nr:hypothetical protein POM88_016307 [Heracleum sosnowskyi]